MGLMEQEEMLRLEQDILHAHDKEHKLEYILSQELFDLAKREQCGYYMTFARLHILYHAIGLRDLELYAKHMQEAERSCRSNDYKPMLMRICNLNGIYYGSLNDEQSALHSFLEGITLGKKLGDMLTLAKLYNNIAEIFRDRADYLEANKYYLKVYSIIDSHPKEFDDDIQGFLLANLVDSCRLVGDLPSAEHYLSQVSPKLDEDGREMQLVRTSMAALLVARGDNAGALELIDKVLRQNPEHGDDLMFAYDALMHIMRTVLAMHNEQYANRVLASLQYICRDNEPGRKLAIQNLYITCCKTFGRVEKLPAAYEEYYHLAASYERKKDAIMSEALKASVLLHESASKKDEYEKRARHLEGMVYTDELTRLYNRRYFNKLVTKAVSDMQATRIGFVMVDIDCFKQYNDCYGHTSGDQLLQAAGDCLSSNASERIMPSRYGGDEFACLCINCTNDEILQYIEDVRASFAERAILHERSLCDDIATLSIGYSNCYMGQTDNIYSVLSQADDALYASKLHGRNTSTCYQPAHSK